jgi:hypothetical protein
MFSIYYPLSSIFETGGSNAAGDGHEFGYRPIDTSVGWGVFGLIDHKNKSFPMTADSLTRNLEKLKVIKELKASSIFNAFSSNEVHIFGRRPVIRRR